MGGHMMLKQRWVRHYHAEQKRMVVNRACAGEYSPLIHAPPIEDSVRSDSSLLKEIRGGAERTAAMFLRKKVLVIRKRAELADGKKDVNQKISGVCLGEKKGKKSFVIYACCCAWSRHGEEDPHN
jgi:hypothetical protein